MINVIIKTVTLGVGAATTIGAGTVITNVIKATTPTDIGTVGKVLVSVGGAATSFVVGDIVGKRFGIIAHSTIDGIKEGIKSGKRHIKEHETEEEA